jgi:hypothetical protein
MRWRRRSRCCAWLRRYDMRYENIELLSVTLWALISLI